MHRRPPKNGSISPRPRGEDARGLIALCGRALEGDAAALETLVHGHEPTLRRLLRIRTTLPAAFVDSIDLVRDLVLFAPPSGRRPRTVPGILLWLCDLLEQRIRSQTSSTERADPWLLDRLVAALDPTERDVVLLRDYLGAGWDEVGTELDLTPERTRELHRRARARCDRGPPKPPDP